MAFVSEARQADDHASRAGLPVRRIQSRKRGNEIDTSVVCHGSRQRLNVCAFLDEPEVVAEPLHERAGDSDAAFEGILRGLVAKFVGYCGEQSKFRMNELGSCIFQHETARPIGVLRFTCLEACLADQRRLLVAENSRDGNILDRIELSLTIHFAARIDLGKQLFRKGIYLKQLLVPRQSPRVEELDEAGVGHNGDMDSSSWAAGQFP